MHQDDVSCVHFICDTELDRKDSLETVSYLVAYFTADLDIFAR